MALSPTSIIKKGKVDEKTEEKRKERKERDVG